VILAIGFSMEAGRRMPAHIPDYALSIVIVYGVE
jgi:hypothetical protein